jgi:hypothetical protein
MVIFSDLIHVPYVRTVGRNHDCEENVCLPDVTVSFVGYFYRKFCVRVYPEDVTNLIRTGAVQRINFSFVITALCFRSCKEAAVLIVSCKLSTRTAY